MLIFVLEGNLDNLSAKIMSLLGLYRMGNHIFEVRGTFFVGEVVLPIWAYGISSLGACGYFVQDMSSINEGIECLKAEAYG